MKDEIVYFDAWWNEQCKGKREDFPCKKRAFEAWKSGVDYGKISNRSDNRWVSVSDGLPERGKGDFLVYWKNQPPLILVCHVDIHGNYIMSGSGGDSCGHGIYPKFSHWQPLPSPPKEKP